VSRSSPGNRLFQGNVADFDQQAVAGCQPALGIRPLRQCVNPGGELRNGLATIDRKLVGGGTKPLQEAHQRCPGRPGYGSHFPEQHSDGEVQTVAVPPQQRPPVPGGSWKAHGVLPTHWLHAAPFVPHACVVRPGWHAARASQQPEHVDASQTHLPALHFAPLSQAAHWTPPVPHAVFPPLMKQVPRSPQHPVGHLEASHNRVPHPEPSSETHRKSRIRFMGTPQKARAAVTATKPGVRATSRRRRCSSACGTACTGSGGVV